nr:hypothetical protein [Micromonospora sp. DSM 115978]
MITATQADVDVGFLVDVVRAVGFTTSGVLVASYPLVNVLPDVNAGPVPSIGAVSLVKSAAPPEFVGAGQTLDYSYLVTNTGNVPLDDLRIGEALSIGSLTCPTGPLSPDESTTCTARHSVDVSDIARGSVDSLAVVTGRPLSGPPVTSAPSGT